MTQVQSDISGIEKAALGAGLLSSIIDPDNNIFGSTMQFVQNSQRQRAKDAEATQLLQSQLARNTMLNKATQQDTNLLKATADSDIAAAQARSRLYEAQATEAEFEITPEIMEAKKQNLLANAQLSGINLDIAQATKQNKIDVSAANAITSEARSREIASRVLVTEAENQFKNTQLAILNNPESSNANKAEAFQMLSLINGKQTLESSKNRAMTNAQKRALFDNSAVGGFITQDGRLGKIDEPINVAFFESWKSSQAANQPQYLKDYDDFFLSTAYKHGTTLKDGSLTVTGGDDTNPREQKEAQSASLKEIIPLAAGVMGQAIEDGFGDDILEAIIAWHPDVFNLSPGQSDKDVLLRTPKSGFFGQIPTPILTVTGLMKEIMETARLTPEQIAEQLASPIAQRTGGNVKTIQQSLEEGKSPENIEKTQGLQTKRRRKQSRNEQMIQGLLGQGAGRGF